MVMARTACDGIAGQCTAALGFPSTAPDFHRRSLVRPATMRRHLSRGRWKAEMAWTRSAGRPRVSALSSMKSYGLSWDREADRCPSMADDRNPRRYGYLARRLTGVR